MIRLVETATPEPIQQRLWVSTYDRDGIKHQIWDTHHPLLLKHTFPFELKFENASPILVATHSNHGMEFNVTQEGPLTSFIFSDRRKITVRSARSLPPVYDDASGVNENPMRSSVLSLYAISGIGKVLTELEAIDSTYVGYSREKPIFTISKNPSGYAVKALLSGVRIKSKTGEETELKAEETSEYSHTSVRSLEILWDLSWWRFNIVQAPLELIGNAKEENDPSATTFKLSIAATSALLIAFLTYAWMTPALPPASIEPKVAPTHEVQAKDPAAPVAEATPEPKKITEVKLIKLPPTLFKPMEKGEKMNLDPGGSGGSAPSTVALKTTGEGGQAPAQKSGTIEPSKAPPQTMQLAQAPVIEKAPEVRAPVKAPPASGIALPGIKGFATKGGAVSKGSLAISPEARSAQILSRNAAEFKEALGGVVAAMQGAPTNAAATVKGPARAGSLFESTHVGKMPVAQVNAADIGVPTGSPEGRIGGISGGFGNGSGIRTTPGKAGGAFVGTGVGWGEGSGLGHGSGNGHGTGTGSGNGSGDGIGNGNGSVTGGLTKQEVGAVIYAHMSEVRYCYENATIQNPNLEGKVLVHFTIGTTGVARDISPTQSSVTDKRVEQCVMKRLALWNFPKPRGNSEVDVSYPFIFKMLEKR